MRFGCVPGKSGDRTVLRTGTQFSGYAVNRAVCSFLSVLQLLPQLE
jgi:hypothetical protein